MANEPNQEKRGRGLLGRAQDALGSAVGMASAATVGSRSAKAFLQNATASNLYEIEAAQIALQRTGSEDVRVLAQTMLRDHQMLGVKLKHAALEIEGIEPAEEKLDNRREGMLDNLREAPQQAFDERYLEQQLAAHREALTLFRGYAENGDHAELKGVAAAAVPILEEHLNHVIRLRGH
jgi:putative membrane protein